MSIVNEAICPGSSLSNILRSFSAEIELKIHEAENSIYSTEQADNENSKRRAVHKDLTWPDLMYGDHGFKLIGQ